MSGTKMLAEFQKDSQILNYLLTDKSWMLDVEYLMLDGCQNATQALKC